MGRYTGPSCRLCRRAGEKLFLKGDRCFSPRCAIERRHIPPGGGGQRRRRVSDYGIHLREKQKARQMYGVMENQFRKYMTDAFNTPGISGNNLLRTLERRLDNVIYLLGFADSRKQARQMVQHGHFNVNGRKTDIPSFLVKPGQTVGLDRNVAPSGVFRRPHRRTAQAHPAQLAHSGPDPDGGARRVDAPGQRAAGNHQLPPHRRVLLKVSCGMLEPQILPPLREPEPEIPDPAIRVLESTDTYARVALEPLERGFATTVGNPLRRLLLSSIQGTAVTWVKIEGVPHEYTVIPGVKEEVMDLLLSVKRIRIHALAKRPGKMRLDVTGEGRVCAGDIATASDYQIVNPELHLATLDNPDVNLSIEFNVESGKGYQRAEQNDTMSGLPVGVLPVDAIYNPVRKVEYTVQPMMVGAQTDWERLILQVWTDGAVTPAGRHPGSLGQPGAAFLHVQPAEPARRFPPGHHQPAGGVRGVPDAH